MLNAPTVAGLRQKARIGIVYNVDRISTILPMLAVVQAADLRMRIPIVRPKMAAAAKVVVISIGMVTLNQGFLKSIFSSLSIFL